MHILVLGGTGPSGLDFITEALAAGHQLTLYARSPSKLPKDVRNNPNVQIVKGEFTDTEAVKEALGKGAKVLVSFAGPAVPNKGLAVTEFYERLFELIQTNGSIRRVLTLSTPSYQVPEDKPGWKWWLAIWLIYLIAGSAYAEINGMGKATASLPLDKIEWTIFRVPQLTKAPAKPIQASMLGDGTDGMILSRKSIAVWVLQELQDRKWIGKAPVLSNPGWI